MSLSCVIHKWAIGINPNRRDLNAATARGAGRCALLHCCGHQAVGGRGTPIVPCCPCGLRRLRPYAPHSSLLPSEEAMPRRERVAVAVSARDLLHVRTAHGRNRLVLASGGGRGALVGLFGQQRDGDVALHQEMLSVFRDVVYPPAVEAGRSAGRTTQERRTIVRSSLR